MKTHFLFVLLFGLLLFPSCELAIPISDEIAPKEPDPTPINSDFDGGLTLYEVNKNEILKIHDYAVPAKYLADQSNVMKHHDMWDYMTHLIPVEHRWMISRYEVFGGDDDVAGYVGPTDRTLNNWQIGLAIDISGIKTTPDLVGFFPYVVIHEYAHLLSLNSDQVDPTISSGNCSTYHMGEGCSMEGSFILAFFEAFWSDIYDEYENIGEERLYAKYSDHFVTEYAASSPEEDFSESFAYFTLLSGTPNGDDIASQKVRFFYDYEEMRDLRSDIRSVGGSAINFRSAPSFRCGYKKNSSPYTGR